MMLVENSTFYKKIVTNEIVTQLSFQRDRYKRSLQRDRHNAIVRDQYMEIVTNKSQQRDHYKEIVIHY